MISWVMFVYSSKPEINIKTEYVKYKHQYDNAKANYIQGHFNSYRYYYEIVDVNLKAHMLFVQTPKSSFELKYLLKAMTDESNLILKEFEAKE